MLLQNFKNSSFGSEELETNYSVLLVTNQLIYYFDFSN